MTSTHLLLLPDDGLTAPTWLVVNADGTVAKNGQPGINADARRVMAVPGAACLSIWLDLPTNNTIQARAAARLMLQERVATDAGDLHIAIGPLPAEGSSRLVVAVESARLQSWIERAAALDFVADIVIPAPLLLPLANDGALHMAEFDGQWLVRGEQLAFAAEPDLATQILDGRVTGKLEDAETAFASGTTDLSINLLQYDFAATVGRPQGWPAWRRSAAMLILLLLSPLLMTMAGALHDRFQATALESQASAVAQSALPSLSADADPVLALRGRLESLRRTDTFVAATGALFMTIAAIDGAELDALDYSDGTLRSTVVLGSEDDMKHLRNGVEDAGLELVETGSGVSGDRYRSELTIRRRP